MDYKITLTDTEKKSMDYITTDIHAWITNAVTERARIAKEEIIAANTKHCNTNSIAIAVGEAAQVAQAFTLGVVQTATERNAESAS